jgi:hypothetical protein
VYWLGAFVALLMLMPAMAGVAFLIGFGECDSPGTSSALQICSPLGRVSLAVGLAAGALVLYLWWVRMLRRLTGIDDKLQPASYTSEPVAAGKFGEKMSLPLGQRLAVGRVESCSVSGRTMMFEGNALFLWSLYPFQKGWIRQGQQLVLVYQITPFSKNLKYPLALWNGPTNSVRGIAAVSQSLSIVIAGACIVIFAMTPAPLSTFWIAVCTLVIIVSSLYLALMLHAKAALRAYIARVGATS